MLLRMGLDVDGQQRITTGGNFVLLGGGEETHEEMVEKTIQSTENSPTKENN